VCDEAFELLKANADALKDTAPDVFKNAFFFGILNIEKATLASLQLAISGESRERVCYDFDVNSMSCMYVSLFMIMFLLAIF
jgi:hypothetical protein